MTRKNSKKKNTYPQNKTSSTVTNQANALSVGQCITEDYLINSHPNNCLWMGRGNSIQIPSRESREKIASELI